MDFVEVGLVWRNLKSIQTIVMFKLMTDLINHADSKIVTKFSLCKQFQIHKRWNAQL